MHLSNIFGKYGLATALGITLALYSTASFSQTKQPAPVSRTTVNSAPLPPFPSAPERNTITVTAAVEPRVREAWLHECRRRLYANDPNYRDGFYIGDSNRGNDNRNKQTPVAEARRLDYDYCDAYFDDYYRSYEIKNTKQAEEPAYQTEIITEEYIPAPKKKISRRRLRRT